MKCRSNFGSFLTSALLMLVATSGAAFSAEVTVARIQQYQIGNDGNILVTMSKKIGGRLCGGSLTNKYVILKSSPGYEGMSSVTMLAAGSRKQVGIEPDKCSAGNDVIPKRIILTF